MRVDVYLITSKRDITIKVRKGPFVSHDGQQEVFVIRGDYAQRVPVKIGITSFDEVEVVEGLSQGDEVIVSDMKEYIHLTQIKIH